MYKHKFYKRQSDCVKYRGDTDQIDIIDSIITVLAKYPGLTGEQVADKIFPKELHWSRQNVIDRLKELSKPIQIDEGCEESEVETPLLAFDGEFYYLFYDAMAHDIGKTKEAMDKLAQLGLSPEQVNFLSGGILAYAEEVKEGKHKEDIVTAEPVEVTGNAFSPNLDEKAKYRAQAIADLKAEREAKEEAERQAKIKAEQERVEREAKAKAEAEAKAKQEAYNALPWWKKLFKGFSPN